MFTTVSYFFFERLPVCSTSQPNSHSNSNSTVCVQKFLKKFKLTIKSFESTSKLEFYFLVVLAIFQLPFGLSRGYALAKLSIFSSTCLIWDFSTNENSPREPKSRHFAAFQVWKLPWCQFSIQQRSPSKSKWNLTKCSIMNWMNRSYQFNTVSSTRYHRSIISLCLRDRFK